MSLSLRVCIISFSSILFRQSTPIINKMIGITRILFFVEYMLNALKLSNKVTFANYPNILVEHGELHFLVVNNISENYRVKTCFSQSNFYKMYKVITSIRHVKILLSFLTIGILILVLGCILGFVIFPNEIKDAVRDVSTCSR